MSKFKIVSANDCTGIYNHPTIPTAINNYLAFKHHWIDGKDNPKKWIKLEEIEDFDNDQDVDHLPTLEDLVEEYMKNPNKFLRSDTGKVKMFPCSVLASQIFSSEKSIYDKTLDCNGYDRPLTQTLAQPLHLSHLKTKDEFTGKSKGFSNQDCMMLGGFINIETINGVKHFSVKKAEGNGRVVKGLVTVKGKDVRFPMNISFHPESLSQLEMHQLEAKMHHVDAEERASQNESQKFASGYAAGIPEYVFCYNLLWDLELDYDGVMNSKRESQGLPLFKSVGSLSGINKGENQGHFRKEKDGSLHCDHPGIEYWKSAALIAKKISDVTEEDVINGTSIQGIASMLHSFCQNLNPTAKDSSLKKPLFSESELENFFVDHAEESRESWEILNERRKKKGSKPLLPNYFKLKEFVVNKSTKSIEAIAARIFFKNKLLVNYYLDITGKTNGFSTDNSNIKHFIRKAKDKSLQDEMRKLLISG